MSLSLLIPVILLGFVAAYYLTAPVEKIFFSGRFYRLALR